MSYQHIIDKATTHWDNAKLLDKAPLERSFAIFCSNILRFRTNTPIEALPELYKSLMVRIALTSHDQQLRDPETSLALSGLEFFNKPELRTHPGIITTFHTGSYRLLGRLFGYHNIPLCVVVSEKVYQTQKTSLIQDFYLGDKGLKTPFSVLSAQRTGALTRMKSKLKAGYNLLIYQDGNVGQKKEVTAESGIPISFMDSEIRVRVGVAGLSLITHAPIYSLVCTRPDWNEVHIQNPLVLRPKLEEDKIGYVHRVMNGLYAELSEILLDRPSEWEGWLYLLPVDQNEPSISIDQIQEARLFPFSFKGKYYAIESPRLRTYVIERPLYQHLRASLKLTWDL